MKAGGFSTSASLSVFRGTGTTQAAENATTAGTVTDIKTVEALGQVLKSPISFWRFLFTDQGIPEEVTPELIIEQAKTDPVMARWLIAYHEDWQRRELHR